MSQPDQILTLARAYSKARNISMARTSSLVRSYGGFLKRLEEGGDCRTRTYNHCLKWFSDHWPEGLDWPSDIPRPAPADNEEKTAA